MKGSRIGLLLLFGVLLAFAAPSAQAQMKWQDSVRVYGKALSERSLQFILDSLGYDIDVANDEIGAQSLCGRYGTNTATMLIEVAGSAAYASSGYYKAHDTSVFYQLFGPSDTPGDSVNFTFSSFDSIGFYMKPNLPGENDRWFSKESYNDDLYDHMWVFPTGTPHEYIIAWEDVDGGGDQDHNDLVIKLRFHNFPPVVTLPADTTVISCNPGQICFPILATDPNCQGDSIHLSKISGLGTFTTQHGKGTISTQHCFTPGGPGTYTFVFKVIDILGATDYDTMNVIVQNGASPVVVVPDLSVEMCTSGQICLPISITDADCDITSVTTNIGSYSGNSSSFDQIAKIRSLGGTVTQVGGTGAGNPLYDAGDFSGTVATTTGVSVTLPNFAFGSSIVSSSGISGSNNMTSQMIGAPTDLTFTLTGSGGPDGTDGDGSADFNNTDNAIIGFPSAITTCNGAKVDIILFCYAASGTNTAEIKLRNGGTTVHTVNVTIPNASSGSGFGGITLDVPDGILFDRIRIEVTGGTFEVDAVAARTAASTSTTDICFNADTSGVYTVSVTATDACGHMTTDVGYVTVQLNRPPVANAGADFSKFQCNFAQICFPVTFSDPDGNLSATSLVSGSGTLSGNQICFTPASTGAHTFIIQATDSCGLTDRDTVVVTVTKNSAPVAVNPSTFTVFQCSPTQVCYQFTATDPNGGTLTWTKLSGAGSITAGGNYCVSPTLSGTYSATVVVTDSCGLADTSNIQYNITINSAPIATNPSTPVSVFQCTATQICYPFAATDINGGTLTWTKLSGSGTITSGGNWCFTPSGSGAYSIQAVVSDSCGAKDTTTLTYNVTINGAPTIAFGNDTSLFLCAPQSICVSYTVSDPQGTAKLTETMVSGFGSIDTLNNKICFTPASAGTYQFIAQVTDSCGLTDKDTVVVTVGFGQAADIVCPATQTKFICATSSICTPITITPGGATITVSPIGTYSSGQLCFNADTSGHYVIKVIASTSCGADTCNVVVDVTKNASPVATNPPTPVSVFQCTAAQICYQFAATDPNGGTLTWTKLSGSGTITSGGNWCFTPSGSGSYSIQAVVQDSCGAKDTTTLTYNVTINGAPTIAFGNDTSIFQCTPAQICLPYTVSDPQGTAKLTETMISGFGSIDTLNNRICFTPSGAGSYQFIAQVQDSCGLNDRDTIVVTITTGQAADIVCPASPINVSLCNTGQVCQALTITPAGATISTNFGTYSGGQLCFQADSSGTYNIRVIASTACGVDTCNLTFNVTIGSAAQISCPGPQSRFICATGSVCIPVGVIGSGATVNVTPIGSYSAGQVCFNADTSGVYNIRMIASTTCGSDTCDLQVTVTKNSPPVATNPTTPVSVFQCTATQICYQFAATDPNGGTLTWTKLSGAGSITTGGNWCFTPAGAGSYSIQAVVQDSCGAKDTTTLTYNVTLNGAPTIAFGNDTSIFQCTPAQICLPYTISDPQGTAKLTETLISGSGTIDTLNNRVCFTPAAAGTYQFIAQVQDSCGLNDRDTIVVTITTGQAADIVCPATQTKFICATTSICTPVTITPAGATVTVSPIGTYSGGNVCFTADTSGHYVIKIIASTTCGADTCNLIVNVTKNSAPIAVQPPTPKDTFICASAQICRQFTVNDVNGGTLTWSRLSGAGTVTSGGLWCFTPGASGSYSVTAAVTDSCGAADTISMTYNVTINSAPVVNFGNDTTMFLCATESKCVFFTSSDPNNNIQSYTLLAGPGFVDVPNNRICWSVTSPGTYQFILQVTDSCGATDVDTVNATVNFNTAPVVNAGANQTIFQCNVAAICWPVSVSDPNGNLQSVQLMGSPGTYNGSTICFTPTGTLNYEFVLKATDSCGVSTYDTVVIYYTLNSPPVANAGPDQTLFQCAPTQVCWPVSASDPDNNLVNYALVSGPGSYNGSTICFTPAASGNHTFIMEATDACGRTDRDTAVIHITINSAPVCVVPNDTSFFQCTPTQICLPAFATDANGNLQFCQIISGPGSLIGNNWCYTPSGDQTVHVIMQCQDSCGATCTSDFVVDIDVNQAPSIAFGADTSIFLCASQQVCIPFTPSDPDYPRPVTITKLSGPGTLDIPNSQICYTPGASGVSTFIVKIQDECGLSDQDTITVNVTINTAPVASLGPNQNLFLCDSTNTLCFPASCTDANGNLADCIFNGPGSYNGSQVCFNPVASGTYTFTLRAEDSCGAFHVDTLTVNVTLNSNPVIALGNDTTIQLCSPTQICFPYAVSDANGLAKLSEFLISGAGSIDTLNNRVCFTPTLAGAYQFIVRVQDSCGDFDQDTLNATITFGSFANITCPSGPINVSLCAPGPVCYMLPIAPAGATVTTTLGTYSAGQLCFNAATSGTYNAKVIATSSCGVDTCDLVFNVTIGSAAQVNCPAPQAVFLCSADSVCVPISVVGSGATVTVSPSGTYSGGNVCFYAGSSGTYNFTVIASTSCGSDTCSFSVTVTINSNPVAQNPPPSVIDTFLCVPTQLCYQFVATDVNGGTLNWIRLSGAGTVSNTGLWCFTPNVTGNYTVTAAVIDSCGAADTVSMTVHVTLNDPPSIAFGNDTTLFQCSSGQICVNYSVSDPNNNVTNEQLISGPGTIDTLNNRVCFTPPSTGVYTIIVQATDACGLTDRDTINVNVQLNAPPVANAGADTSLFLCSSTSVCRPVSATDPNGNLTGITLISGPGTLGGGQICFTPASSGAYTFIIQATDACGLTDRDTVVVTITINVGPICNLPNDTTFFQCTPTQVSLPVGATDPNGNFDHCEIVSGPGTIIGNNWVFTPSADQTVVVKIQCLDQCGAGCVDSFKVVFDINTPPVANAGKDSTFFMCGTGQICWPAGCTDVDNNLTNCQLISANGTYSGGQICFNVPAGERSYIFVLQSTDACGAVDVDTSIITIDFNEPPVLNLPPDFTAYLDAPGQTCFDANISDPNNNLSSVTVTPTGTYDAFNDQICFNADSSGEYCFVITATDGCGAQTIDTLCITIQIDECIHVQIEKTHDAIQGQVEHVQIYLNGSGKQLGGYDLLIAYDASAVVPLSAAPGNAFEACGWEYFSYRLGANGNCGNACPSGALRITAIAETNNGAYHPSCFLDGQLGSLADIQFLVSNDRTLECQYVPIRFFWLDCGDNGFADRSGDTLYVSREVYDFEFNNITNNSYGFPGYYGVKDSCMIGGGPGKPRPIRCVDYTNGGIDIVCADSIDARGDINLNEIAYEVSDAVLYSNYFVFGLSVFNINQEGQIAASDVNGDGIPLSVADLVYLIRVVIGDAPPMPKINPNDLPEVAFSFENGVLSIAEAKDKIGAISVIFEGEVQATLNEKLAGMELRSNFDGKDTRMLIYSSSGRGFVETGTIITVTGGTKTIKSIEAGSYDGAMMKVDVGNSLPAKFSLSQNYPNPFNPKTTIKFSLPKKTEFTLTVYNILGQKVTQWKDEHDAGVVKIEWDASQYASGVYFYKLEAGTYSDTKKMLLVK